MAVAIPLEKKFNSVFPVILGTVIEYYDYALYGFCASLLAEQFFPNDALDIALLKTFGIFLSGSLAKPLGAIVFGIIGDRFGRRLALRLSMIGIVIPTVMIGCLPNYESIGWLSPFLLLLCRILQGLFVAGESDGARVFLYESLGSKWQCFLNNLAGLSCMMGVYLASMMASWAQSCGLANVWRIPFLFGGGLGILVYGYRTGLVESLAYLDYSKSNPQQTISWISAVSQNKRYVFAAILLCGASGGAYHFYLVFLGNYLSSILNILNPEKMRRLMSISVLIYAIASPVAGLLADYFGAIRVMTFSLIGLIIAAYLNIIMLKQGSCDTTLVFMTALLVSFFQAPGFVLLFRHFKTPVRYRCMSLGHSIGSMLFSGTAPCIGLMIWHATNLAYAPMFYFIFLISLGLAAIFILKE
jgi:MHS family proline/betaine transporter-like MFS transporter